MPAVLWRHLVALQRFAPDAADRPGRRPGPRGVARTHRSASPGAQGKDAVPFLESLVVGDIAGLKNGTGSLSVMTNERGGIIDDTVITKVRCRCIPAA